MTLVYFVANNKAQLEALYESKVRNVSIDFSYFKKNKLHPLMEFNVLINAGKNKKITAEKYYEKIVEWQKDFDFQALQYDNNDIKMNLSYYHLGISMGIRNLIPIIHGDYRIGLNYINPMLKSDTIALGKGLGNTEEDDLLKKLPRNIKYHGLGKYRWFDKIHSVDTMSWLNLIKNGKTYIMLKGQKMEVSLDSPEFAQAQREHEKWMSMIGFDVNKPFVTGTKELLKIPFALFYMPLFYDSKDSFWSNFN